MKKAMFRERNTAPPLELDIVIYHKFIAEIGGIETWLYYIGKKYNIGQITVLYDTASKNQLKRLEPHIRCIQYTGQQIKCNKIIFTMTLTIPQELYDCAEKRYVIVHCNYNKIYDYGYAEIPKMDKVYAVSDTARDSYKRLQEQEVFTLYNPVAPDKPQRLLKLISATRLTKEKRSRKNTYAI